MACEQNPNEVPHNPGRVFRETELAGFHAFVDGEMKAKETTPKERNAFHHFLGTQIQSLREVDLQDFEPAEQAKVAVTIQSQLLDLTNLDLSF